jgi:hypothetical protein
MNGSDYQRPPFPIAWARKNAMRFRQMLVVAVAWAMGLEDASIAANMSGVTPHASVMPSEN